MFALKNLIRLPAKTILLWIVILTVLFMLMWSTFLSSLCTDTIDRKIGDLNGTVKVSDVNSGDVPISLFRAEEFCSNFGIITGYAASSESICAIKDADHFAVDDLSAASDPYAHRVIACTSMQTIDSVISGSIYMVSGNGITEDDQRQAKCKVVVSDAYAKKNNIGIGDSLILSWQMSGADDVEQEFVIGGIYQISDTLVQDAKYNYQIAENTVFIPLSTHRIIQNNEFLSLNSLYFYLKHNNEATVKRLEERFHEIGFDNIELKLYTPENVAASIAKLLSVLRVTSVVVMLCGILVLFVVIFLNIQSRKKEIAILIAVGKPYLHIVRSLFIEVLVIGALSAVNAVLLFILTATAGKNSIIGYLTSDAMASEFQNTSSETFYSSIKQQEAVIQATDISVAEPIMFALGMFVVVGIIAWAVISFSAKKTNPMLVFGEDA